MSEPIPLERQIACVRREVGMRQRVYPRWVESNKMTHAQSDREIATMQAVQATLEGLLEQQKAAQAAAVPGLF